MLDQYIFGDAHRVSPEAPVPVVDVAEKDMRLGGAANVALNLRAMGAQVSLATVIGDDETGYLLKQLLQDEGIDSSNVVLDQKRRTTLKTRVMSRNQQMLRFDEEDRGYIDENIELLLLDNVIDAIYNDKPHAIVFQDYNKGVLTPRVIANVISNAKQAGIPIAVDPKENNFFAYKGCQLFKPNLREAIEGLNRPLAADSIEDLQAADKELREILMHDFSIITLSDKGIFVGTATDHEVIPAFYRNIVDVSGAGDTVISLLTLGLALGLDIFATAELANIAAGLVCEKVGVSAVDKDLLLQESEIIMGGD